MLPVPHPLVVTLLQSSVLATGLVVAAVLAARLAGRPLPPPVAFAAGALLLFVGLTMLPLPDPARLACPVPSAVPSFVPFGEFRRQLWLFDVLPGDWAARAIRSGLASAALNVVFCLPIGFGLRRCGLSSWAAVAAGFGLSLAVEVTQLTGNWGLWPCAFRKFDVDDLLANTLGVALGVGLAWALRPRAPAPRVSSRPWPARRPR